MDFMNSLIHVSSMKQLLDGLDDTIKHKLLNYDDLYNIFIKYDIDILNLPTR